MSKAIGEQAQTASLLASAQGMSKELIDIRRQLHRRPELSGQEKATAALVSEKLRGLGYEVTEQVGGYGVCGFLSGGEAGKTVALRADMDALSIEEQNDVPYKSQTAGVMHACGHDNHVAMLLGAAKLLKDRQKSLQGNIKLLFQPAEEMSPVGGSRAMMEAGALTGVDAVFGLHVWPSLPHGTVGVKSGAMMAASDHFSVTLHGRSSHAGQPDEGIDAVVMGAQLVQAVQDLVSREISPLRPAVVTIGRFRAGSRYNILAETCELEGTCRTFHEAVRSHIEKRLKAIVDGICLMHGAEGELHYERGYAAVVNHEAMTNISFAAASHLFGEEKAVRVEEASMCAEDFAFYLKERPGSFVWLGTGTETLSYPLHNARFDVDEDILWRGAALLAQTAVEFFMLNNRRLL